MNERQADREIALEIARLRLAQAKVRDPGRNVAMAAARLELAKAAMQAAQAAYDRRASQPGSEASSEAANLHKATLDHTLAQLQHEQAVENQEASQYDILVLEQNVRLAELALQQAGEVDPVLAQEVLKAQLAVDRLQVQWEKGRLIAPIDGIVTMVALKVGKTFSAFKPAIRIAPPGELEVTAEVYAVIMERLSTGQKCTISIIDYPDRTFHGRIRRLPYPYGGGGVVSETELEDKSTRVSIDDLGEGDSLTKGAVVHVSVLFQEKEDVLWLPPDAVRTYAGRDFVVVQGEDVQRRIPIKVGITSQDRIEILEGVSEGQVVLGP